MKKNFWTKNSKKLTTFLQKENNYVDQQRQIIYLCYSLVMAIGCSANILGITGSFAPFYSLTNSILIAIIIFTSVLYLTKRISIVLATTILSLAVQTFISLDNWYAALTPTLPNQILVILINMLILAGNLIISLSTYMTRVTQVNTGIAFVTYIGSMICSNSQALEDYCIIVLLILLSISLLGFQIAQNAKRLESENQTLRRDETELLQILRLNKAQVKAYIKLAKEKHPTEQTRQLLDILGETSQKNLIANVKEFMVHQDTEKAKINMTFPELTSSEKEICQLILRDKKLGEICKILNKTESNINTQRANIRKKLGLKPTDNLQQMLAHRMYHHF